MLPAEVAKYLDDPDKWIVKSDEELCQASDAGVPRRPYWDPVLRRSRSEMKTFLRVLDQNCLLTFRRRSRSSIGAFFVAKKSGDVRFVIDARIPMFLPSSATLV